MQGCGKQLMEIYMATDFAWKFGCIVKRLVYCYSCTSVVSNTFAHRETMSAINTFRKRGKHKIFIYLNYNILK